MPTTDEGWTVERREAPAELGADYKAPPFTPELEPHITGWASILERLDAESLRVIAGFSSIGGNDASV